MAPKRHCHVITGDLNDIEMPLRLVWQSISSMKHNIKILLAFNGF